MTSENIPLHNFRTLVHDLCTLSAELATCPTERAPNIIESINLTKETLEEMASLEKYNQTEKLANTIRCIIVDKKPRNCAQCRILKIVDTDDKPLALCSIMGRVVTRPRVGRPSFCPLVAEEDAFDWVMHQPVTEKECPEEPDYTPEEKTFGWTTNDEETT